MNCFQVAKWGCIYFKTNFNAKNMVIYNSPNVIVTVSYARKDILEPNFNKHLLKDKVMLKIFQIYNINCLLSLKIQSKFLAV